MLFVLLKKKSVLYSWAFFYGLILILMVVTCAFLGRHAQKQLVHEYKMITQSLQARTNEEISDYFADLEQTAYEICNDYLINDFVFSATPYGSKYYSLSPIQKRLAIHALQANDTVYRYLYMDNIDRTLSDCAIYQTKEFYRQLDLASFITEPEFEELLSRHRYNELCVFDENGSRAAMMISSIPQIASQPKGALIQVLNLDHLDEMLRSSAVVENSTAVLVSREGKILCDVGDPKVADSLKRTDYSAEQDSEIVLSGENYWFQSNTLSAANLDLITVIPIKSIREKTEWIIYRSLPILLIMVFIMAVLSLCFLHLQYKPLNRLSKAMSADSGKKRTGNEYDQMMMAFTDVRSSRDQIQLLWNRQQEQLVHEFVESCIEGNIIYDEAHLKQVLGHFGADFAGEWFGVILIEIGTGDADAEKQLIQSVIETILPQYACAHKIYLVAHGEQWVIVLNDESAEKAQESINRLCAALEQPQESGCTVICTSSAPQQYFQNINLAFLDVCEKEQYRKNTQLHTGEVTGKPELPLQVPRLTSEQEMLLLQYIAAGSVQEAQSILALVIHNNYEQPTLPIHVCRCLANDILCGVLRRTGTYPEVWKQEKDHLRNDLHLLRHAVKRDEFGKILTESVARTAQAFAVYHNQNAAGREQTIDRILQCVNEHYRDTDFNVSKAAEYLGISVPYLSNLFKQHMGIGLLSYISGLRIQYAKKCIVEQHLSVAQAAHESGFENINTFIRIFKKHEGTTPGNMDV